MTEVNGGGSGSIWTIKDSCGDKTQDENQYNFGDTVYINGANFEPGEYDWTITGNPGGSSCNPGVIVASGSYTVDSSGSFCIEEAYTVQSDDCGEYKVNFDGKKDNYHVIPEFGLFAGIITLASAVGLFFIIRKK